jgi:hypothetical protein
MTRADMARVHARRRRALALVCFSALLGLIVLSARVQTAGAEGGGPLVAEPVLSATAAGVRTLFGASPREAPGEVWGVGETSREGGDIVRYTEASGWEAVPNPVDSEGHTVALARTAVPAEAAAGRTTAAGGVVMVASTGPVNSREPQALLVRDPGGPFRVVTPPPAPIIEPTEKLFAFGFRTKLAAVEEPGGQTGAFVVPSTGNSLTKAILHYDGTEWTREPICAKAAPNVCNLTSGGPSIGFAVLAIGATSSGNAWLLAQQRQSSPAEVKAGHIVLLRREEGTWRPQGAKSLAEPSLTGPIGSLFARESNLVNGVKVIVAARENGQPLTVTTEGLWIDASLTAPTETSDATLFFNIERNEVTGSWCDLQGAAAAMCTRPLGSLLPAGEGRGFAWPGNGGPGEEFGSRAITGVGQGAMLVFENGAFSRIPLDGNGGSSAGAAIAWPEKEGLGAGHGIEGWLGPSLRLTREPIASGLAPWPVPFRRPLTAIVAQPGTTVGSIESQALAVGQNGQVARYKPGIGWQAESLLTGAGTVAKPNLRGVAWPEPNFAYAVGDEGAMWLWRGSTGLWEPDPGAPTNLIRGNFTGIAFQPGEPTRGYAVGKQGLLLAYGRRWTQERLPAGISPEANITSIAFAGSEALATWTLPVKAAEGGVKETGGLLVNDGSGWRVEEEAPKALEPAEPGVGTVAPRRVAGLPDGGAVIVGLGGGVIEREAAGAPWHAVPGAPLGYPAALAAIREGGQVRAIVSVEGNPSGNLPTSSLEQISDEPQAIGQPPEGQPPLLTGPYPLPKNGYLVRQTATGWHDEQRQSYPTNSHIEGESEYDYPRVPDAVLALLISPDGSGGWAVGGNTGENGTPELSFQREALQTAGVLRYGVSAAPPQNASSAPITIHPEDEAATFAVGGGAGCAGPCADLEATGIGPSVWLRAAVGKAAAITGLRGFLYTGGGVSSSAAKLSRFAFGEEEAAYARRLGSGAGALPVYAAPAASDLFGGTLAAFSEKFAGFQQPLGSTTPRAGTYPLAAGEPAARGSYELESRSASNEMAVRVIVLNESVMPLAAETQCWLASHLSQAKEAHTPVLVMGNREVGTETELRHILVTGETAACPIPGPGAASAYLFESRANREQALTWGTTSIPAYGTGTLGYVNVSQPALNQFSPTSGFLLVSVTGPPNAINNVAPVSKALVPNIESLAIEADDGTFLRRSQVALFEALARRPVAGFRCSGPNSPGACAGVSPDPYAKIPARCIRGFENASCAAEILPQYEFTSSRPDIANFVKVDPASTNPRAVYLQKGKPVADPQSGLLCTFNAGTTTVTVSTGGLSYSVPVTVQAGSVAQPCGTVPLTEKPVTPPAPTAPPLPPTESPPTTFNQPGTTLPSPTPPSPSPVPTPIVSTPHAPAVQHPIKPPATIQPPFFAAPVPAIALIPVIVPPPPAPVVEPTPPSGTSPVTQPAVSPEPEEEEEAAFDLVHHMSAYGHQRARNAAAVISSGSGDAPSLRYFVPALALLLALAGVGIATPRRRTSRLAYETRATPRRHPR